MNHMEACFETVHCSINIHELFTDDSSFLGSWAHVCKTLLCRIVAENVQNTKSSCSTGTGNMLNYSPGRPKLSATWVFIIILIGLNLAATDNTCCYNGISKSS